jgi:D-3-phosphoglycerate dehydrogenase / 2-oxoglutarate reductase
MSDIFVSTVPFGNIDPLPIRLIEEAGLTYQINPLGRKLKPGEIGQFLKDVKVIVAGTEEIGKADIAGAKSLRLVARVGIGLDNVDLAAARDYGIGVSYTPDAPSPAVAELTIGLILDLARGITVSDKGVRNAQWSRYMGKRVHDLTVGVIGIGRIGFRVIRLLQSFRCRILANDLNPDPRFGPDMGVEWVDKERLYRESDIISVHVPLTQKTRGLVGPAELALMKADAALINTARGGIVDEDALYSALKSGSLRAAAMDVFEREPYQGPLTGLDNVILTQHMGSCTVDCRLRMEREATEEAIRILKGQPLRSPVPQEYYHDR